MPDNPLIARANQLSETLSNQQLLGYVTALLEHSIRVQNEKSAQIIEAINKGVSVSIDNISVRVPVEIDTPLEITGSVDVSNAWEFDFT
jgi:hypothetical protein